MKNRAPSQRSSSLQGPSKQNPAGRPPTPPLQKKSKGPSVKVKDRAAPQHPNKLHGPTGMGLRTKTAQDD